MFHLLRGRAILLAMCLLISGARANAQIDEAQFKSDLNAIAAAPSRVIGSSGYEQAGRYLESEIGKLPHVELKRQDFSVVVPVTQSATLDIGSGRIEAVYPFWPAHVRVCSTPPEGIRGNLVYVGQCRYEDLKPASLAGQIAVIEAAAGSRWSEPFYLGAKAILVLGSPDTGWPDLKDHDLRIPVSMPRFYVPPGALADDLRAGRIADATLKATVQWQPKRAVNYYALVPANKPTPSQSPGALMFSVPYDASSLVPDLAPGAGQAVQAAAGLALLRDLSRHPLDRPVIVFFSGADTIQFLGTRNMFLALGTAPATWNDELATLNDKLADAQRDLARATELMDAPQRLSPVDDRRLVGWIVEMIDTDLADAQDQLFRLRSLRPADQTADTRRDLASLDDRQAALNRLKLAVAQHPAELMDANQSAATDVMKRVAARLQGLLLSDQSRKDDLQKRIALHDWLADAETGHRDATHRLIELLVGLDLSDHGSRAGPMFLGYFQRASSLPQVQLYNDWFAKLERSFAAHTAGSEWWGAVRGVVDLDTINQTRAPVTYLAGPLPLASELAQAWGTPGMSMITLDDMRLRRDTPTDTLANLNVNPILRQLIGVRELFWHAWNDPKFRGPIELKQLNVSFAGQVVGAAPGKPVPDLPRPGFLAAYYYLQTAGASHKIPRLGILPWTLGIRRDEVRDCDAEGNYRFEGMPRMRSDRLEGGSSREQNDMQVFAVHVYRFDSASGAITATTDLGKQSGDAGWAVDIKQDVPLVRSLAFNCQEFSLSGLYDPRYLQTLSEMVPIDARRDAEPQRYCMWLDNKMLAGFVEPGTRNALLIRFGRVGNRLILVNMAERSNAKGELDEGRGYSVDQLNHIGPLALATSRDFYRLNDDRLTNYRRAGVSSALIDSLHDSAARQLRDAERSLSGDDDVGLTRESTGAWANEARVYDAAQEMARDVVRAAIFLLMLCVPFSFCMERLLIATPNVYKQIAGIGAIFLVMTLALWTFHPAFKISASPLIIVLAFAIIAMSLLVIFVIYGKFDTELKRMRSGRGVAQGATFANAGVLMSAVLLGIANMRKRKFRTVLTSITIVLITFAVLWFTSTAHYRGTTALPTGVASAHPGILLRQRGFRPMAELVTDQLRAVLADPALNLGAPPQVVERWWAVSAADPKEQYDLVVPASGAKPSRTVAVQSVLGLSPGESQLTRIAEVVGANQFARLENGERSVIYLSDIAADELKVREGDRIRLGGTDLQVAGIFSAAAFDQKVAMLSGESIAPLKYLAGELDAGGRLMNETNSDALELSGSASAAEAGSIYEHLPASQMVIVPASVCRTLNNSSLRCVAFRLQDQKQVEAVSDELTRRFALAMYAGFDDGVRMVAAGNLASVSGASQVAVPLAIAGLIIFNTMMGSIAERRREIHVYTSLGLAPMHVGALFVAEAMTYGLVGTVFGYIIGQGLGTLMLKMGWLGSITLNYSG
ncbi:MAG TPA: ABC transporter permease, partial [Tepidisphaeraceae bacterium]|nr:ABC transporter permease [Tepidisphaeraceae bacterium]